MLREFYVDNYKSLINVSFSPKPVSLLLGVNNSGKTNLCEAMRFLAATAYMKLDDCAGRISGGPMEIRNRYFDRKLIEFRVKADLPFREETISFDYRLVIRVGEPSASSRLEVDGESLSVNAPGFEDVVLLESSGDQATLLRESAHVPGQPVRIQAVANRDTTLLNRVFDLWENPRATSFKHYLLSWVYYALSPEAMRGFEHQSQTWVLETNGRNLASVIYNFKNTNERRYRELVKQLQKLDESIDAINHYQAGSNNVVMVFDDREQHHQPAATASSGTLAYLALMYIVLAQPAQMQFSQRGLCLIEEPENWIYVGFLRHILDAAEQSSDRVQFVFTSHSPYFIDQFDDRLDSVFQIRRTANHSRLEQLDIEKTRKLLEKLPLGEQHFRELLTT